ncbi:uncharacterized protein PADG_01692 [Paracoccidioides brasiliensis Pb18]|uniref:Uncharacterized protein n=1 Tax=Paracoccidioides brasiliensis (strain Pb18) TaxID=502780 RepID=C1G426_PARBD|nr:uncharacterized protein PADG_01692 [Paracoccidioides brasiliensis Pb18]EEH45542.2 hypothetical protein PADG_01692 [Paracoccidioides brasiliensis Pb18]
MSRLCFLPSRSPLAQKPLITRMEKKFYTLYAVFHKYMCDLRDAGIQNYDENGEQEILFITEAESLNDAGMIDVETTDGRGCSNPFFYYYTRFIQPSTCGRRSKYLFDYLARISKSLNDPPAEIDIHKFTEERNLGPDWEDYLDPS